MKNILFCFSTMSPAASAISKNSHLLSDVFEKRQEQV
ncbi:MAG: hypothetical protein A4E34_02821 [Methanoregula sp. PtaU1.Bin006]|nr:MAG: hypothetical protein A4E33_02278 [Methanoregula sp. PtaB.Bin085]OPY31628.1 MAG: hypothetical protein A4E34_02821 [Methanoregula sp. PtaU1.Bin006]